MPQTPSTIRALAWRPAVLVSCVALLAAGAASGSLPLLETPGYELGEAAALLAVLLAPVAGIAAVRLERRRPVPSPLAAFAAAAGVTGALVAAAVLGAVARAAAGPCTAVGRAFGFVPLLALPSVLLGAALAVAAGFAARGRRAAAALLYAAAAAASLALSLRAAYTGPPAFVFDPLLGAWPGPIYDEALLPDLRAVLFRAGATAWAAAVVAATAAAVRARRAGMRAAAAPIAAGLVAVALAGASAVAREELGLSGSRAALARALGGRRDGDRCTIFFPGEKPAPAAAAILAECEFHVVDLAAILGISPPRVSVFLYRSTDEKRRLVGAAATEYAKPWLREVHVVDAPVPHPVLRHELVHALGAGIARGPLGVPARRLVLVSAGLVEGLAAGLETPRGRFTVHEWSRAARDLGLLPDVAALVGPAAFYLQPPARAYTAAGSFLAFLLERHGAARVREAYRTGDVARALGFPLRTLVEDWHRFLDRVEEPPGLVAALRPRLSRGSLFTRRCARQVAEVEVRAGAAASAAAACGLQEGAAARSCDAVDLKALADDRARAGDLAGAARAYRDAAARAGDDDPALRFAIATAQGDVAWRLGEIAAAVAAWSTALSTRPERAEARLLEAKIVAASDPALAPVALPYLLGEADPAAALPRLAPIPRPLAAYLAGRARAVRGEDAAAVPELARAVDGRLPPELAREAALLLGSARCAAGDADAGQATLRPLADAGLAADRARAAEALRRCEFERRRGTR